MRKLVTSVVVAGSMVAGGAAGVMLGIPGISHAASTTVTAGSDATTAATTATTTPGAPKPGGPLASIIDNALKGLVDNKTINQSQSDAVKKAIQDQLATLPHRGPGGPGPGGFGRKGGPGGPAGFAKADVLGVASKVLGLSADDITTQVKAGKSLAEIAKSKNIDPQKLIDALVADGTAKIDQAVKDSKLTNDQAATIKGNLKDRITNLVNNAKPGHPGGDRKGFGGPPPDANGSSSSTKPASYTTA